MQRVELEVAGKRVDIYNVHLCVWNRAARVAQAEYLAEWINRESRDVDYLVGGRFLIFKPISEVHQSRKRISANRHSLINSVKI